MWKFRGQANMNTNQKQSKAKRQNSFINLKKLNKSSKKIKKFQQLNFPKIPLITSQNKIFFSKNHRAACVSVNPKPLMKTTFLGLACTISSPPHPLKSPSSRSPNTSTTRTYFSSPNWDQDSINPNRIMAAISIPWQRSCRKGGFKFQVLI